MSDLKTRDELAISMPMEAIPEVKGYEGLVGIAKIVGIDIEAEDPQSDEDSAVLLAKIAHSWQAYNRYLYADAMIAMREKTLELPGDSETTDQEG